MKNFKRIFSILGIVILVGLYVATLVFALIDSPWAFECLKVSIGFTIIIPILLWIYIAMFRYMKQHRKSNQSASSLEDDMEKQEDF